MEPTACRAIFCAARRPRIDTFSAPLRVSGMSAQRVHGGLSTHANPEYRTNQILRETRVIARAFASIAIVMTAACGSSSDSGTSPSIVATTTVTLGLAVATDAYRPSGLPVTWSGYCPVASPSTVTLTAGNAYQIVNRADRSVDVITLPDRRPIETIAAGGTGVKHIEFGAVSQPSFTFTLTVAGCTDAWSGQGLLNVTVNSK